jgi:hypothetical protein
MTPTNTGGAYGLNAALAPLCVDPSSPVYAMFTPTFVFTNTHGPRYCLYKYKKTLTQLLAEKPKTHAALLKALEEAIELHEAIKAAKKAEEEKMEELRKIAEAGTGVKAMKAKAELEQMRVRSQTGANMADVRAAYVTFFLFIHFDLSPPALPPSAQTNPHSVILAIIDVASCSHGHIGFALLWWPRVKVNTT